MIPSAVLQEPLRSCWGNHSTQGAQHVALTPAHCRCRGGTSPLSRMLNVFWKHWRYFTCIAIALHLCSNTRVFQKVLERLLYLFHTGTLGVRCRAAAGGSAWHSMDAAGPGPPLKDRLVRHTDILDHQSCSSKSVQMRLLREGGCTWGAGLGWRIELNK